MELSKRLETIVSLVTPGETVADIGTDHGYVPVELVRRGTCRRALAMDVREGPLAFARSHIQAAGLSDRIETRVSDGLEKLAPGEADRIVIAGMGGALMRRILADGETVARSAGQLVLSPQSDWDGFRRFLGEQHYRIQQEAMVRDEGKYYVILLVSNGEPEVYTEAEYAYGRHIRPEDWALKQEYLSRRLRQLRQLETGLRQAASPRAASRLPEVLRELALVQQAGQFGEESV